MTPVPNDSRRRFLQRGITLLVAAPAAGLATRIAAAQDRVDPSDPTAKALAYVEDATKSDKRTDTTQDCAACHLYTGKAGDEWGPCSLFPGKVVHANGWCSAFVKKA